MHDLGLTATRLSQVRLAGFSHAGCLMSDRRKTPGHDTHGPSVPVDTHSPSDQTGKRESLHGQDTV